MLKLSGSFMVGTLVLATIFTVGCSSEPKTKQNTRSGGTGVDARGEDSQGVISMALSSNLPAGVDQIRVTLTKSPASKSGEPPQSYSFPSHAALEMSELKPATYFLVLEFIDTFTAKVLIRAEGSATVQAGKTTRATVYKRGDASSHGGLIIEIQDDSNPFEKRCTTEFMEPACIKDGNGYKMQTFTKDNSCVWQPANVTRVDDSLCEEFPVPVLEPTVCGPYVGVRSR